MKQFGFWKTWTLPASLCLTIAFSIWAGIRGWGSPLNIQYDFVQSKAAIITYYLAKGGPIFRYELPVSGPPWAIPYEFPIFQLISAWVHNTTGASIESSGRLVAKGFYFLSCFPIYSIAKSLGFQKRTALIPVIFFLVSPLYLFWSRQFMNESTALFFGLAYLSMMMNWSIKTSFSKIAVGIIFGVFAAVTKSTTYASFALATTIYFLFQTFKDRPVSLTRLSGMTLSLIVPLIVGLAWVRFTDYVKLQNPFAADFHTTAALSKWYFQSDRQALFDGAFWNRIFRITIHDSIGHRAVWIVSIILAVLNGKKTYLYWLCSALFLIAPTIFTRVHMLHDYYANANAIFLIFAIAALARHLVEADQRWKNAIGAAFIILVVTLEVREFMRRGHIQQEMIRSSSIAFGKKLKAITDPNQILLFYGEDWCPLIPFYAERKAIMMWRENYYNSKLQVSLRLLQNERKGVGAVVLCHEARTDQELIGSLHLGALILSDTCDVYEYKPI